MVDLGTARARTCDITTIISHEGRQHPAFATTSQNIAVTVVLLDTLPAPSTDGLDSVYY
jgi:hypothetical protein